MICRDCDLEMVVAEFADGWLICPRCEFAAEDPKRRRGA